MRIVMIEKSVLKGVGPVNKGKVLTDKDADVIELRRLVAYGKAIESDDAVTDAKPTADEIKQDVSEKQQREKISIKPKGGLSTKSAGGLKG